MVRLLRPLLARLGRAEATLANENLCRNLLRTSMTVGALTVSVAMASGVSALVGSFVASAVEWIDQSLPADLWISSAGLPGSPQHMPMSNAFGQELARIHGVAEVERVRVVDINFRGVPTKLASMDIAIYGHWAKLTMLEGRPDEAQRKLERGAVVVSENFARLFDVHIGDRIPLSTRSGTQSFEVAGVNVDYTSDRGTILIDHAVRVAHWGDDRVGGYKIHLKPSADLERVRTLITERYGEQHDLLVLTNSDLKGQYIALVDQTFSVMRTLELLAVIIAVLGVVNGLLASVLDRVRELGVLRAVGALRRQVQRIVILEGLMIGGAGVIGGTLLGDPVGRVLLHYANVVQTGWYFPYQTPYLALLGVSLLVLAASALAAGFPARHAASLVVVDALHCK
jgi:putative ABC transport system permease protein